MFNLKLNKPTAKLPFPLHSMIFAPMEGVTNATYRRVIRSLYPEWDALCADFIRVPSNGLYPTKFLIKHIGQDVLENSKELQKTMVQILTSPVGRTFDTVRQLVDLGVYWLDLNIGCPSGTVVKHQGGSYWLKETAKLFELVKNIRALHPHFFSVKMRIGFENSDNFLRILKEFEALGVDAITVHARTREQMYSTPADWNYIKSAVETVNIPIIANGDIWTLEDKDRVINQTGCHSAMIARGALKCPWLPKTLDSVVDKKIEISKYFHALTLAWQLEDVHEVNIVKKIKELSRYLYEDVEGGEITKRQILLSKNFEEQKRYIYEYSN